MRMPLVPRQFASQAPIPPPIPCLHHPPCLLSSRTPSCWILAPPNHALNRSWAQFGRCYRHGQGQELGTYAEVTSASVGTSKVGHQQ
jgi:hypothetical protein